MFGSGSWIARVLGMLWCKVHKGRKILIHRWDWNLVQRPLRGTWDSDYNCKDRSITIKIGLKSAHRSIHTLGLAPMSL